MVQVCCASVFQPVQTNCVYKYSGVRGARKVAGALAGLCTWARAMALYVDIAKVVKPKMESLKIAEGKLKSANAKLAKAQGELDQVAAELDEMQRQFDEAMATKQALQDDADACNKKMDPNISS